jgi:hypothetical protein
MKLQLAIFAALVVSTHAGAQMPTAGSYAFPLFVDGALNGVTYHSALRIVNTDTSNPALQCSLTQRQLSAAFVGVNGDRYYADVFDAGDSPPAITAISLDRYLPWEILRTNSQARLQTGYAVLSCPGNVHTEVQISLLDSGGSKLGETTVQPASEGTSFTFLVDRRDNTRLGFALANDSSIEGQFTVIARDEFNEEVDREYDTLGARAQTSRFVDEMLRLPANFVGTVEVVGVPGGHNYVVGLQFTGGVFATIQPLVRSVPLSY